MSPHRFGGLVAISTFVVLSTACGSPTSTEPEIAETTRDSASDTALRPQWTRTVLPGNLSGAVAATDSDGNVVLVSSSGGDLILAKYGPNNAPLFGPVVHSVGTSDGVVSVAIDSAGNVYVAGWSGSGSTSNYSTLRFSPDLVHQWTAVFDSGGEDSLYALALDVAGFVVVTGRSGTVKYAAATGSQVWQQPGPGSSVEVRPSDGRILVTGTTTIDVGGGVLEDHMVTRQLAPWGDVEWSHDWGKGDGLAVKVDAAGDVLVAGNSPVSLVTGTRSLLVVKYSAGGTLLWDEDFAGGDIPYLPGGNALAVDSLGGAIVAGNTNTGDTNYLVRKYSSAGVLDWSREYDGPAQTEDQAWGVAVGLGNEIFVTGFTYSSGYTLMATTTLMYRSDGYLYGLHSHAFTSQPYGFNYPYSIVVDLQGNVIVAGITEKGATFDPFAFAIKYKLDRDGDGILDHWETQGQGIDVNGDGLFEFEPYALGARIDHKDIFIEVDAMAGVLNTTELLDAIGRVEVAFDNAPSPQIENPDGLPGINLIIDTNELNLTAAAWPLAKADYWTAFYAIKTAHFGTIADRDAKALVSRYCVVAQEFGTKDRGGEAEYHGNDFFIALGSPLWLQEFGRAGFTPERRIRTIAGTFMHELGHTLGLDHGGGDSVDHKPNYHSVMNYTWQIPIDSHETSWVLEYSAHVNASINEQQVSEVAGFSDDVAHAAVYPGHIIPIGPCPLQAGVSVDFKPEWGPVELDTPPNGTIGSILPRDVNDLCDKAAPNPTEVLTGFDDWANLNWLLSENSEWLVDGAPISPIGQEFSVDTMRRMSGECGNVPPGEGCACFPGESQPCGSNTDVGECVIGSQACDTSTNAWGECIGDVAPASEFCNALDDDCDGASDEDFAVGSACDGADGDNCNEGIVQCDGSGGTLCTDTTSTNVETCNAFDDDCDGSSDEAPLPGVDDACTTGLPGICSAGTVVCSIGTLQCSQTNAATTELCNALDDDCDGVVDDGCTTLTLTVTGTGEGSVLVLPSPGGTCTRTCPTPGVTCTETCTYSYPTGTSVGLTASAPGAMWKGWSGDTSCTTGLTCTVDLSAPKSITARSMDSFNLSLTKTGFGMASIVSTPTGINCGTACTSQIGAFADQDSVTLVATVSPTSTLVEWTGDCTGVLPTCTLTMGAPSKSVNAVINAEGQYLTSQAYSDTGSGYGRAVAYDSAGNLYFAGGYSGAMTIGATTLNSNPGSGDIYVAKMSPIGTVLWAKSFGGTANEYVEDLTVDGAGNVVLAGRYNSATLSFGGASLSNAGDYDAFVARLSASDGSHLMSKSIGGSTWDGAAAVRVDTSNRIIVVGSFTGTVAFSWPSGLRTSSGLTDVFVAWYGLTGAFLAVDHHSGSGASASTSAGDAYSMAVTSDAVYVVGTFAGSMTIGGIARTSAGSKDIFVIRQTGPGAVEWWQRYGGSGSESAGGVATVGSDAVIVGGFSTNFTMGATLLTTSGNNDVLLSRISAASGAVVWATADGGAGGDSALGIASDARGNVTITGFFNSTATFAWVSLTESATGLGDIFVVNYDENGTVRWAKKYGAGADTDSGSDLGYKVAADSVGNLAVTGRFWGMVNFGGGTKTANGSSSDMFFLKLGP